MSFSLGQTKLSIIHVYGCPRGGIPPLTLYIIILIPGPHCHNRQSMVTGKQRNQDGVKSACLYFRESEM